MTDDVRSRFGPVMDVFDDALEDLVSGKGKQRHQDFPNQPFVEQYMIRAGSHFGYGALLFQVGKKIEEIARIDREKGEVAGDHELLQAINYLAGALVVRRRLREKVAPPPAPQPVEFAQTGGNEYLGLTILDTPTRGAIFPLAARPDLTPCQLECAGAPHYHYHRIINKEKPNGA